jgi:hypothetical protein
MKNYASSYQIYLPRHYYFPHPAHRAAGRGLKGLKSRFGNERVEFISISLKGAGEPTKI